MFVRQVGNWPAGRLVAWDKASGQPIEPRLPVSIGLVEDPVEGCSGPIWLRGGIAVVSADGFEYELRNRVTLCRCGASRNKPFCDGTHASIKISGAVKSRDFKFKCLNRVRLNRQMVSAEAVCDFVSERRVN